MEKILCAAIYIDNGIEYPFGQTSIAGSGLVIAGFSHDEIRKVIIAVKITMAADVQRLIQTDGFLTTHNRFVSRTTAAKIAYCTKQIKKETHELISSDLLQQE